MDYWDERPRWLDYRGQTIEVFTRGALAKALNRAVVSIRSLEQRGILRTPMLQDSHGRWLYTRDQIEDLIALAKEEGVLDPHPRTQYSDQFVTVAHQILKRSP